jgi:hypothetical protein
MSPTLPAVPAFVVVPTFDPILPFEISPILPAVPVVVPTLVGRGTVLPAMPPAVVPGRNRLMYLLLPVWVRDGNARGLTLAGAPTPRDGIAREGTAPEGMARAAVPAELGRCVELLCVQLEAGSVVRKTRASAEAATQL